MVTVRPFAAVRPRPDLAAKIAAVPYDVISTEEAREIIAANPTSFVTVSKPEATLPDGIDQYDERVYARGRENYAKLLQDGLLIKDATPHFYVYKQIMGSHVQVGLVASASTLDYEENRIKKHELTRQDKEDDRMHHIETLNSQTGPVFLVYRANQSVAAVLSKVMTSAPLYDFTDDTGVHHTFWRMNDTRDIESIQSEFAGMPCLYVADGHHRSAAAVRIAQKRRAANSQHTGHEEYNGFLTVIFPHNQMQIMAYNRVIRKIPLKGGVAELMEKISARFDIAPAPDGMPSGVHDIRMYIGSKWQRLTPKAGTFDASDPVCLLDVDILQKNLLAPLLGIDNPRKSRNIDFVGGIRGIGALTKLVDSGEFVCAFSLNPVTIEQLMAIADADKIMPPKSTWFEPKLKDALAIHEY
ncbi:MAG: DUF1015 family protein [Candidatus Brocadiia bacterium]